MKTHKMTLDGLKVQSFVTETRKRLRGGYQICFTHEDGCATAPPGEFCDNPYGAQTCTGLCFCAI